MNSDIQNKTAGGNGKRFREGRNRAGRQKEKIQAADKPYRAEQADLSDAFARRAVLHSVFVRSHVRHHARLERLPSEVRHRGQPVGRLGKLPSVVFLSRSSACHQKHADYLRAEALRLLPLPILVALLLNEVFNKSYKKAVQTMIYLPNFISWVVLAASSKRCLPKTNGAINNLIALFGGERVAFMIRPEFFRTILIVAEIWKGTGWGTIIYIAAISGHRRVAVRSGENRRLQARFHYSANHAPHDFPRHYRHVHHAAFQHHERGLRFGV